MQFLSTKYGKSSSKNTNRPPTNSTVPHQGKPCHPIPEYFDKYFWTHGCGSHKGVNCNSEAPGHKDKATTEIRTDRSNHGCKKLWCGTVPNIATNNNRSILLKSTDSTLVPPNIISYKHTVLKKSCKTIILRAYKGATEKYIRGQDTIIVKNPRPKTTGPRVCLPDNSIIKPTLSGHLPLPTLS